MLVCEKNIQGDASGESILTGFGSSSGSSTDETSEQEEFLDELTRQMTEHMLQEEEEDGEKEPIFIQQANNNKHKTTLFEPNNVVQNQLQQGKKYGQERVEEKEHGVGGFMSSAVPNGSGMRVVFLGDQSGSRNGSVGGTGVFIPQAPPTKTPLRHQPRKNPAGRGSRVLIPERVLHSLKQHHERRNASQAHPNALFHAHQNQMLQHQETPNKTLVNSNKDDPDGDAELQLPQEWTY